MLDQLERVQRPQPREEIGPQTGGSKLFGRDMGKPFQAGVVEKVQQRMVALERQHGVVDTLVLLPSTLRVHIHPKLTAGERAPVGQRKRIGLEDDHVGVDPHGAGIARVQILAQDGETGEVGPGQQRGWTHFPVGHRHPIKQGIVDKSVSVASTSRPAFYGRHALCEPSRHIVGAIRLNYDDSHAESFAKVQRH